MVVAACLVTGGLLSVDPNIHTKSGTTVGGGNGGHCAGAGVGGGAGCGDGEIGHGMQVETVMCTTEWKKRKQSGKSGVHDC